MADYAQDIRAELIDPTPILLRPVNKLSQEYLDMVADFKEFGHFGNSILVRPSQDRYEVVDGMYRWTAGHEANLKFFQCIIKEMTDKEVLIWQVKLNATRKDTDPIEYARHLHRLMNLEQQPPTLKELSDLIGKSRNWVCKMLSLTELLPEYQRMLTRGQITLGNAQLLAKLKPYLQPEHIDSAKHQSTAEFKQTVSAAVNRFRESLKTGNVEAYWSEEIKPYVRRLPDICDELNNWHNGGMMLAKHGAISPLDGWKLAVQWLMNMDPERLSFRKARMQRVEQEKLDEKERLARIRETRRRMLDADA